MFPQWLLEKLLNSEIKFPDLVEFNYATIKPIFRVVEREKDDWSPVTRKDFKSYYELGKKPKIKRPRGVPEDYLKDPKYYGVSTSTSKDYFEQVKIFPKPNKKIARGSLYEELGPIFRENKHICLWPYDGVDIDGFELEREQ